MADAAIVCAKCKAPSTGGLACASCGGGLVKLCPACNFKNSPQKKYCDHCGQEFGKSAPPKPAGQAPGPALPPPISPAGPSAPPAVARPDAVVPQTMIVRKPAQPASPEPALPQAGRSQNAFAAPVTRVPATSKKPQAKTSRPGRLDGLADLAADLLARLAYIVKSALAILFLLALAFGGFLYYLQYRKINSPARFTTDLAQRYLELLKNGDYANAYFMLSSAAKADNSLDDFRLARDPTSWTWSNLTLLKLEPDLALFGYDMTVQGHQPQKEYLFFVLENGSWTRPYNWNQLQKADTALNGNDPDMAVIQSQEAVNINPRDPLARAYLCEAEYFRRLPADTDSTCRQALALAEKYPSKVQGEGLLHVYAILADNLRGQLGRPADAAAVYGQALSLDGLPAADRCDFLRARSQAYAAAGLAAQAQADAAAASSPCGNVSHARAQLPMR